MVLMMHMVRMMRSTCGSRLKCLLIPRLRLCVACLSEAGVMMMLIDELLLRLVCWIRIWVLFWRS